MGKATTFSKYAGSFGSYSWVILFVRCGADEVAEACAKATSQPLHRDAPIAVGAHGSFAPWGGVVGVANSEWTLFFQSLGHWAEHIGAKVAHGTKSDALVFQAEDTSGSIGCELIVPGKPLQRFYEQQDAETQLEFYEFCDQEPPPHEIVESYPELFQSLGIVTVQPYCTEDRSVVASAEDVERIERFHFVGDTPWASHS